MDLVLSRPSFWGKCLANWVESVSADGAVQRRGRCSAQERWSHCSGHESVQENGLVIFKTLSIYEQLV